MNDLEKNKVEKALAMFIAKRRPPAHLRQELDLSFRFDGRNVEIFEVRPNWNDRSHTHEEAVAKASYVKSRNVWLVYWQRADFRWHKYEPAPEVNSFEAFLALVDRDEYGCFFG